MEKHAKLLEQFSTEAHFSKVIHAGKKSISLSLDELSVLSVGFTWKQWGREEDVSTLSHTNRPVCAHAHDHTAINVDSLPTADLGNAHKSLKCRHTNVHYFKKAFLSHKGKPHTRILKKRKTGKGYSKCHFAQCRVLFNNNL